MKKFGSVLYKIWEGILTICFSLLGIVGALIKTLLTVLTLGCILGLCAGIVIFIKVKPELDHCREVAYDKLATMDRSDFSMLSDTIIYDKDGNQIGLINAGHYEYVDINHISMNLQNAYIAQEDRRFKSHTGVDWIATMRAGLALIKHSGAITQGGSTITQQVIKNTYLTQEQTFTRKVVEILLAPEVEKKFSKADIMEFYCNTNFYGHQCNGIQAASRYYFGKKASELEPYEAAVLVGISNSPSAYDPVRHPEASLKKRNDVLKSMYEVGFLTKEEYESYIDMPLSIVQETMEGTDESYQTSYAIHCAALELMKLDGFEFQYLFENKEDYTAYMERYDEAYSQKTDSIRAGGYQIYTSLDHTLQNQLQEAIDLGLSSYTELQENGKFALQGAGALVDNQTNYVVAIVGGRGTEDQFNRAYLSARQPGSTIKPLIDYAPAFDTGNYYPSRMVDDHKWEDGPSNSGGSYHGNVTIREALNRSLNTVAWQVLEDIGINKGLAYLGEMEFQKLSYVDNGIPSLSIGGFTNGVRVVDMAKGFSTLANYGVYNDRTCISKIIHERDGELTKNSRPATKQVYLEDSAFMITDILKGTMTAPYGTGRGLSLNGGMPCAGKTGTTNSSKDTWFCGYTRYYTAAIWVGYDIPRAMPGIYGSTYAGKIWKRLMDQIHADLEPWDWEVPVTVVQQRDESNGITDYFSTTAELRAKQAEHDKEQDVMLAELKNTVSAFENKTIANAADGYWVQDTYRSMIAQISLMDENEERSQLLERIEARYETFQTQLSSMSAEIQAYADRKAAEEEAARRRAAAAAEARRQQEAAAAAAAAQAAAEAQAAAAAQATAPPETQPETTPDYSAGPGAFQNNSPGGSTSGQVTIIPQGPGGGNE
ncbi:MAG: transglycosylase domain-containing protein [Lachnospiraceae bacterium]|nr:transglycosylase domain-containing protein [Lachnospiraceae bacterium]